MLSNIYGVANPKATIITVNIIPLIGPAKAIPKAVPKYGAMHGVDNKTKNTPLRNSNIILFDWYLLIFLFMLGVLNLKMPIICAIKNTMHHITETKK